MSVLIVGSEGSMGKRYQAIFTYFGIPFSKVDIHSTPESVMDLSSSAKRIVIASPTHTHAKLIEAFSSVGKPILCEKPLSTDINELEIIKSLVRTKKINLTMMMQYKMLDPIAQRGLTVYDYFKHGNDGLYWDCMQLIALARGPVEIMETSPIWRCKLNGRDLQLGEMDKAYMDFVKQWLTAPGDDINRLMDYHHKVIELQ